MLAATAFAAPGGHLFATFRGENTPLAEQVYFATSREGREWAVLAGGDFQPSQGFKFPCRFRHGSVLPPSAEALRRVEGGVRPVRVAP